MSKKNFLKGAAVLTAAGIITKIFGFFFRIMLSRETGSEGMGLYQLVMPVMAVCTALCISGFDAAVSRFCAYYTSKGDRHSAAVYTVLCFLMSMAACTVCTLAVYRFSGVIAHRVFKNDECSPLIKTLVLSLPFSCIHTIVCSHFIGRSKVWLSALSQLLEQIVRILSVYLLIRLYRSRGEMCDASIGIAGLVIGEIFSAALCSEVIIIHKKRYAGYLLPQNMAVPPEASHGGKLLPYIRKIMKMSFPISANRLMLHVLQSVEAALIPMMLQVHGMSLSEAMSAYGIVTGMAMPVILFPAALANSVSTLLLPSVSKISDDGEALKKSASGALLFSLLFGFFCITGFMTAGAGFAAYIFNEPSLSGYIRILAWLCPFMFIGTTFKSMLHALGKTAPVLFASMLSESISIVFIVVFMPRFGISAYLSGLLAAQSVNALLCLFFFAKAINHRS